MMIHKRQRDARTLPATFAVIFFCALTALALIAPALATAQSRGNAATQTSGSPAPSASPSPAASLLRRTTTRRETRRFGYASTLTINGAPEGSITIEAWQRNEMELTADIELRGATEEDLARLATVNNFVMDEDANHIRILTTGTHDRQFMRRAARNFPRNLLGLPWRIDYRLRVPAMTDLEIFAGRGALTLTGVEGAIRINAAESDATLALSGGDLEATFGSGTVTFRPLVRAWRGRGANIRLATGVLNVELPANFSADISAQVLRTGRIENSYDALTPLERTTPTERNFQGRAGAGGTPFLFTVTDGTLRIKQQ